MEKPKDKPPGGIMRNLPFRSAEHGGDLVMHTPADDTFPEIFPAEAIHFRKPTVKEWKGCMDFLMKKFGTEDIKDFIKKHAGKEVFHIKFTLNSEGRRELCGLFGSNP
jgi:hypothetical protein